MPMRSKNFFTAGKGDLNALKAVKSYYNNYSCFSVKQYLDETRKTNVIINNQAVNTKYSAKR